MNKNKSLNYTNARLRKILECSASGPVHTRSNGFVDLEINGKKTHVLLEPAHKITQWFVTFNGIKFEKPMGMSRVYKEIAKLNPPANYGEI